MKKLITVIFVITVLTLGRTAFFPEGYLESAKSQVPAERFEDFSSSYNSGEKTGIFALYGGRSFCVGSPFGNDTSGNFQTHWRKKSFQDDPSASSF